MGGSGASAQSVLYRLCCFTQKQAAATRAWPSDPGCLRPSQVAVQGVKFPSGPGTARATILPLLELLGFWVEVSSQETQACIFQKGNPSQVLQNKLLLSD